MKKRGHTSVGPATRRPAGRGEAGRWALLVLLVLAAGRALPARAQQVLVQANVADDTVKNVFGPNRRYFGHLYLGYALVAGPAGSGAAVRYGPASAELRLGGRLKRRLSQTLALNLDLAYAYQAYGLVQNAQKTLPTPALHRRESLSGHWLASELSLRLNVGRRGNYVGRYLDLLAGGGRLLGSAHTTDDDPAPGIGAVQTTERGLPYLQPWAADLGARLGWDRYAVLARYRTTEASRPAYGWPALPRWRVGLEIGLF